MPGPNDIPTERHDDKPKSLYVLASHIDPFHPCLPCIVIVAHTPPLGASRVARGDEACLVIRCGNCGIESHAFGREFNLAELDAWIEEHCADGDS